MSNIRAAVANLGLRGPLPEEDAEIAGGVLEHYDNLLHDVVEPLSVNEAIVLAGLFPKTARFGMEWTLVHLLEKSAEWPSSALAAVKSERWRDVMAERVKAQP